MYNGAAAGDSPPRGYWDTASRNSPGIFARRRRWQNRSLRSHGDCRVSPVDRSTTVKVIHETTKRSFRRRTHPRRRRRLFADPLVYAIRLNRSEAREGFFTVSHRRNTAATPRTLEREGKERQRKRVGDSGGFSRSRV